MLDSCAKTAAVAHAVVENGKLMLTLKDGARVAPLVSLIVHQGGEVEEVRNGQGSLEEVFLTLMEEEQYMNADLMTVLWKEWKEILLQRSAGGGGARQPLIVIAVVGILVPLRMGPRVFFGLEHPLLLTFLSAVTISAVVAEPSPGSGNGTPWRLCWPAAFRIAPSCWANLALASDSAG